jgi:hypothetical protein
LRAAGTDVAVVQADAGDPEHLRGALSPLFADPGAPGVVIYNAALAAADELLTVSPQQLADACRGTPFDPDSIADAYWTICNERPDAWREEYRFQGAEEPAAPTS